MTDGPPLIRRSTTSDDLQAALRETGSRLPKFVCTESDFEIQDEIGRGGFGVVYSALYKRTGQTVALKKILEGRLEGDRFRRYVLEIDTMVHSISPYVVSLVGFSVEPPYLIASDFIPGGTLSQYLHHKGESLTPTQMTIIALGIASGLRLIHSKNILHRDLKGSNILLDSNRYPHIGDLGIARFGGPERRKTKKIGSLSYMAPEIIDGGDYDAKVDMYSYGIVLYEMSERHHALKGIKTIADLREHLIVRKEKPKISDQTSPICAKLIRKCTNLDPAKRFTADAVVHFIRDHVKDLFPRTNAADVREYEKWAHRELRSTAKPAAPAAHDFTKQKPPAARKVPDYREDGFYGFIVGVSATMRTAEFAPLIPQFMHYFESDETPEELLWLFVEAFSKFSRRTSNIIRPLAEAGFFKRMPIADKVINPAIDLFFELAQHEPTYITLELVPQFCELVSLAPEKGVALIVVLDQSVPAAILLPIFLAVIDQATNALIGSKAAATLIRGITDLMGREQDRPPGVVATIARYIDSDDEETVKAAYHFLLVFANPLPRIPEGTLIGHLARKELFTYAAQVIATLPVVRPSAEVLRACLRSARESAAWLIVTAMGRTLEGQKFLIANPEWLERSRDSPKSAFKLAMLIAMTPELRRQLARLAGYPALLTVAAAEADDQLLAAVPELVGRCEVTAEIAARLSGVGFWETYFKAVSASRDREVHANCMVLINRFFRVGWVREFGDYLRELPRILEGSPELTIQAIGLLVAISFAKQGAELILELNLIQYFERISGNQQYGASAQQILANVRKFYQG